MSEKIRAQVGDQVTVFLQDPDDSIIRGRVEYVPQDVGDSWVIVDGQRNIWHVLLFQCMKVEGRTAPMKEPA